MISQPPPGAIKFAALSCSHAPLQDAEAINDICREIRAWDPHTVLHLGDAHEADSASRWPSEYDWTLEDEYREANEVFWKLRTAAPNVEDCIFLPGNHDANLLAVGRVDRKVRGLTDWNARQYNKKGAWLNEELLTNWTIGANYTYHRTKGAYRIGSVVFAHGYEHGTSGDEIQAITMGVPYGLYISGHTHAPTEGKPRRAMRTKAVPLPYWYLNVGNSRTMECDYMERKRQWGWGHGLVIGWALPVKSPRMRPTWDAECLVFRYYDDLVR